ncbi:MAG: hypothetical protein FI718_04245 [SAR202 cluster bacterium]|nr:hypothetical protein [SAR202 cluster bacterium]|tara:strand:+ start:4745 stop:5038 length:294 start_codon:yes stop_codon:yes gene_type:complete
MDPNILFNYEWTEIGKSLTFLWISALCVIIASGHILLGHVILPSLVESYNLPKFIQKQRIPLYLVSAVFYGAAMWFLIQFIIGSKDVIALFWNDFLI